MSNFGDVRDHLPRSVGTSVPVGHPLPLPAGGLSCDFGYVQLHAAFVLLHLAVLCWFLYSAPHTLRTLRGFIAGGSAFTIATHALLSGQCGSKSVALVMHPHLWCITPSPHCRVHDLLVLINTLPTAAVATYFVAFQAFKSDGARRAGTLMFLIALAILNMMACCWWIHSPSWHSESLRVVRLLTFMMVLVAEYRQKEMAAPAPEWLWLFAFFALGAVIRQPGVVVPQGGESSIVHGNPGPVYHTSFTVMQLAIFSRFLYESNHAPMILRCLICAWTAVSVSYHALIGSWPSPLVSAVLHAYFETVPLARVTMLHWVMNQLIVSVIATHFIIRNSQPQQDWPSWP